MKRWLDLFRQKYRSTIRAWKPLIVEATKRFGVNEAGMVTGLMLFASGLYAIYPPLSSLFLGLAMIAISVINARM